MNTQLGVEYKAITGSSEYGAFKQALAQSVYDGTLTEAEYQTQVRAYVQEKLDANDGELRRRTIAVGIASDVGIAGGAAVIGSQLLFGNEVDKKIITGFFGNGGSVSPRL
jgi:hypothetical protein